MAQQINEAESLSVKLESTRLCCFELKPFSPQAMKRLKNTQLILGVVLSLAMVMIELFGYRIWAVSFGIPCAGAMILAFAFGEYTYRRPSQYGYMATVVFCTAAASCSVLTIIDSLGNLGYSYHGRDLFVNIVCYAAMILTCLIEIGVTVTWNLVFFRITPDSTKGPKPIMIGHSLNQILQSSQESGYRITIESGNCVISNDDKTMDSDSKMVDEPPRYES